MTNHSFQESKLANALCCEVPNLAEYLMASFYSPEGSTYQIEKATLIEPIFFKDSMSGYCLKTPSGSGGEILIGMILGGGGFCLKRTSQQNETLVVRYDYFNAEAVFTFSSPTPKLELSIVDFYHMDSNCPILNHLYNFLSMEYQKMGKAPQETKLIHFVEILLKKISHLSKKHDSRSFVIIPSLSRHSQVDLCLNSIFDQKLKIESDPVLTWDERQEIYHKLNKDLNHIIKTKKRAHRLSWWRYSGLKFYLYLKNFLKRFQLRPWDNTKGIISFLTWKKVIWFFQTVRNNLGYSIALAVYGPFTYYFITMPMNPHAMQAVGKVRAFYLDIKSKINHITDQSLDSKTLSRKVPEMMADRSLSDKVTVSSSASQKSIPLISNSFSQVALTPKSHFYLSTDHQNLNNIEWSERMSQFKQMEIAYEENIEYASRMGRLEQLETQFNFPMQVEATWNEIIRYQNLIHDFRSKNNLISNQLNQYLLNELQRSQQLQLYLWDKLSRFMQDQIYVMLDQDHEQKRNDYYVGRPFIFMEEVTNFLASFYQDMKIPKGYEKIKKLAKFYQNTRKDKGSILANLQTHSKIFQQKNIYDTHEFRAYMKRQWEILFLQNSKAEEASNMGLNMYNWSIRNTIWGMQSIYSTKRDEFDLVTSRNYSATKSPLSEEDFLRFKKASHIYEIFLHNLTLEYVSIKEELSQRLKTDIESVQREMILENIKKFIVERQKIYSSRRLSSSMAASMEDTLLPKKDQSSASALGNKE